MPSLGRAAGLSALPRALPAIAHDFCPLAMKQLADQVVDELQHRFLLSRWVRLETVNRGNLSCGGGPYRRGCQIRAVLARPRVLNLVTIRPLCGGSLGSPRYLTDTNSLPGTAILAPASTRPARGQRPADRALAASSSACSSSSVRRHWEQTRNGTGSPSGPSTIRIVDSGCRGRVSHSSQRAVAASGSARRAMNSGSPGSSIGARRQPMSATPSPYSLALL